MPTNEEEISTQELTTEERITTIGELPASESVADSDKIILEHTDGGTESATVQQLKSGLETSSHASNTYATKTELSNTKNSIVNTSLDCTDGDLNKTIKAGLYRVYNTTANSPRTEYGVVLVYGQKTDIPSGFEQWIWQLISFTDGKIYQRYSINGNSDNPSNWSSWQELATKQSMSYTRELDNAFIIDINTEFGTDNQPALIKYGAINVPNGFNWGARTVKWCSSNLIFVELDWVSGNDTLVHKSIACYINGEWRGWKEL